VKWKPVEGSKAESTERTDQAIEGKREEKISDVTNKKMSDDSAPMPTIATN